MARQYGEVVLPDASTGHDPDTLARMLIPVASQYGAVFAITARDGFIMIAV